jgi:hypothetical protein
MTKGVFIMRKRDILIQNPENLNYVGLCKDGVFKLKIKINDTFEEVVHIEKVKNNDENTTFKMTKLPPLVTTQKEEIWGYVEECFYHFYPDIKEQVLTKEERVKIMKYFGENP